MKKQFLLILALILSFNCYSQISFEKGYFMDHSNQKTNCFIEKIDWNNNPTKFKYKTSENGELQTISIKLVKEFGIDNFSKYIKSEVKIDRSSEAIQDLSYDKKPIFNKEELFLKVLIEGKANLYEYIDGNLKRYFYKTENSNIEQLIYKSYKTIGNSIGENNGFRQQLLVNLKCNNSKLSEIKNIRYTKNSLLKFFTKYNKCNNNDFVIYDLKPKRNFFNLSIRPRVNNSKLVLNNTLAKERTLELERKTGFGIGIEFEYILPLYKNNWAIAIEPTYQSYESEKSLNVSSISSGGLKTEVKYSSIEVPVCLRHYFFFNEKSKLFINASYIFDISSGSKINILRADDSNFANLNLDSVSNYAFGVGYKFQDTYSFELRYMTNRRITEENATWVSAYKNISFIFGYSLF